MLKVEFVRVVPQSYTIIVKVLEGPNPMTGRYYRMLPESVSSCTGLGRSRGFLVALPGVQKVKGSSHLIAAAYDRSWTDVLFSLFGMEPYSRAGSRHVEIPLEAA